MSLPRSTRILVIEDEPDMIFTYETIFKRITKEGDSLSQAVYAGGLSQAISAIDRHTPFHVVILDLKLPTTAGSSDAGEIFSYGEHRIQSGLDLIDHLARREHYPIPVLLILTGNERYLIGSLAQTTSLQEMFYRVDIQEKGDPKEIEAYIRSAIEASQRYTDFGIALKDSDDSYWPILTAREEDLIRRIGLADENHAGIELKWVHAENKKLSKDKRSWTKGLIGHFWLQGNDAVSKSYFLKIEDPSLAKGSIASTKKLADLAQHIQVKGSASSPSRCISIVSLASWSGQSPLSLSELMCLPPPEVEPVVSRLVVDISKQLSLLGASSTVPKNSRNLLWAWHNPEIYDTYYRSLNGHADYLPSLVLDKVGNLFTNEWVTWRPMLHGDLHSGNVVVDFHAEPPKAFLIDPGPMHGGPVGSDLAALEVSVVLHLASAPDSIWQTVAHMYDSEAAVTPSLDTAGENILSLVKAIRKTAESEVEQAIYTLLLLDAALGQFGGLAYSGSGNKIRRPGDSLVLYQSLAKRVLNN